MQNNKIENHAMNTKTSTLKVKTNLKAGKLALNRNETLVRG